MLSLGTYPEVSLKDARQRRDASRKLIAAGGDPGQQRKADKAVVAEKAEATRLAVAGLPGPGTFEHVARDWLVTVHEVKVSAGHAKRTRIRFEQDAFPWIGRRPVAEIDAPELLATLRRVTARGAIETAHRLKDACGQVFRFGIATGACARNPATDLRDALPPVPTRRLAAIVEPAKAAELLRAMGDYAGHPVTRAALALSALLFLRPGELRQLEWAWVDLDGAQVTIPGALMKRRKDDKLNGAPPCRGAGAAGGGDIQGTAPADWHRSVCVPVASVQGSADEREHGECRAAPHGFRPRHGNSARLSRNGSHDGRRAIGD